MGMPEWFRKQIQNARKRRRERIYILPTKFGGMFLVGASTMILVGNSYGNNLVNLLAFFLLSLLIASMVQTHANLRDLRASSAGVAPGSAGSETQGWVLVENRGSAPKHALEARLRAADRRELALRELEMPDAPIAARGSMRLRGAYSVGRRGRKSVASVQISTAYPMGLFRAWTTRELDVAYYVYPRPEGPIAEAPSAPTREFASENDAPHAGGFADAADFRGHRRTRPGDSHRRIDWRALARGRPMMTKEFDGAERAAARIDWNDTAALGDTEARLSQIAKWIENLEAARAPFSLRMPGRAFGPASGAEHVARCLEELAAFDGAADGGAA